ncbi:transposase for insertion sequence element IS231E [Bacillus cereus VDM062]|nr:transposase for insertion sequence element IS231E [Bacillus cereus VDM062]
MNASVIHYSGKIIFLILNFLSFYLHTCNFSENTVCNIRSNDSKKWKSLFKIAHYRNVKQERLEYHVYEKLLSISLCSSTMFKMRQLILQKKQKELSEYKATAMIQDYLYILYQAIQQNTQDITKILVCLFHLLQKNGQKSHQYEKKRSLISWVLSEYNGLKKQKKSA